MNYLDYFKEIANIPHITYHTKKISDYVCDFAKKNGLEYYQDDKNNVIVYKSCPNIGERNRSSVILQSHLDMVGVSVDGRDMKTTSIELKIGDNKISACGTSLGADNGIGVSFILDILSDTNLDHPDIQAVFTVDEEDGMEGIENLDFSRLNSKFVINLDSEDEREVIVSSAGGIDEEITIPFDERFFEERKGNIVDIKLYGMTGGHSGCCIQYGRANAIMCLSNILLNIANSYDIFFVALDGGNMRNAIPDFASARFLYTGNDIEELLGQINKEIAKMKTKYFQTDPNLQSDVSLIRDASSMCLTDRKSVV